jgi:biopolymer transport protein ExbD
VPKVQAIPSAGPQRGTRGHRVSTSLAEINVVPLVDVMLVLLVIFMVTAPMIQRGVDINIPVSTRSGPIVNERVFVSVPATFHQDHMLYLGTEMVRLDVLGERIRQKMEGRQDKEVYLRGDATLIYQDLTDVMDRLKGAGVTKIGLMQRQPGEH